MDKAANKENHDEALLAEQKELSRNTFKIQRHLYSRKDTIFILDFKSVLSLVRESNAQKQEQLNRLRDQRQLNEKSRNVIPFSQLLSAKMKQGQFEKEMAAVSKDCDLEENCRECLTFAHQRMVDDMRILRQNINSHAFFLFKLSQNQTLAKCLKKTYWFQSLKASTQLQLTIDDVERTTLDASSKVRDRSTNFRKLKHKIGVLEQENAQLKYRMIKLDKFNATLKTEMTVVAGSRKHDSGLVMAGRKGSEEFLGTISRIVELSLVRNVRLFRQSFINACEQQTQQADVGNDDLVLVNEVRLLLDGLVGSKKGGSPQSDEAGTESSPQCRTIANAPQNAVAPHDFRRTAEHNDGLSDSKELLKLQTKLRSLPVRFLSSLLTHQHSDLNDSIKQHLKYFEEFHRNLSRNCSRYQLEFNKLMESKVEDPQVDEGCKLGTFVMKERLLDSLRGKVRLLFSMRELVRPFCLKLKRFVEAVALVCEERSVELDCASAAFFEGLKDWRPFETGCSPSFDECVVRKSTSEFSDASEECSDRRLIDSLSWLCKRFPMLFERAAVCPANQFIFFDDFSAEVKALIVCCRQLASCHDRVTQKPTAVGRTVEPFKLAPLRGQMAIVSKTNGFKNGKEKVKESKKSEPNSVN